MSEDWETFAEELANAFVDLNNDMTCENLTRAAEKIVQLIDLLQIGILKLAKSDITNNMKKVGKSSELLENRIPSCRRAASGALWLGNTFEFIKELMFLIVDTKYADKSPGEIARLAYENTLKKYHNAATSCIFAAGFKTLPSREKFEQRLGIVSMDNVRPKIHRFHHEADRAVVRIRSSL
ncbi:putative glycolipid transfer protein [Giardia muris]|uniref:Putative glycolipid transfer protein n=1 Tax=Giardia muris TaxID=5742 RepID=A0A4Z1TBB1_GIAMU|nr:putative glycolipid transfer protein [Giardia muris]|eukprot:TNJ30537.1 putative glycolipid transfer protein [Giardia muris]